MGHSSGEIAAACAAGLLSEEDAIKAAFYRGQAAVATNNTGKSDVGMLAAGLGAEAATSYLTGSEGAVEIACHNSPDSVTLSGPVAALEETKALLVKDGHFARMLQVNLAYHSRHMDAIGEIYAGMLARDFTCKTPPAHAPKMFSSVLGRAMDGPADAAYWKANMVSPVLFDSAVREAIADKTTGANFLIEIGPSGALAGPVAQIKKALPGGATVEYCTALSRGQDAVLSMFDAAGRLFLADAPVDLAKVNETPAKPRVVVDLPNYSWNHATKYWYESAASKDWRYRMFPHHDLIGTKILGTSYHAPVWKKALSVNDLPWLKDHRVSFEASAVTSLVRLVTRTNSVTDGSRHRLPGRRLHGHGHRGCRPDHQGVGYA